MRPGTTPRGAGAAAIAAGAGPGAAPAPRSKKEGKWRKWAVALALGLLLLIEGALSASSLAPSSAAASPWYYQPDLAFGCLAGGIVLVLLSLEPLWKEIQRRRGSGGGKRRARALPSPYREAAAFARRRRGQGPDEALALLEVDLGQGLSFRQAWERLVACGDNLLETAYAPSFLAIFLDEIYEGPQLLLLFVGVAYALLGSVEEAVTAFIVILLMVNAEIVTEYRAKRALATLKQTAPRSASVIRDEGKELEVPVREVVPGDVIVLRAGMEVPADVLLLSATALEVGESSLTGEAIPSRKIAASGFSGASLSSSSSSALTTPTKDTATTSSSSSTAVGSGYGGGGYQAGAAAASGGFVSVAMDEGGSGEEEEGGEGGYTHEDDVAYAGTFVTRGKGVGVALATGQATVLGRILSRTKRTKPPRTELQKLLKGIAKKLTMVALSASFVGAALGWLRGGHWKDAVLTGLALAFATIPEELPILIAGVLAVGALALSHQRIYVKSLKAQENLAYVDVIVTDKTGTLTENRLALARMLLPSSAISPHYLEGTSFSEADLASLVKAWAYTCASVGTTPAAGSSSIGARPPLAKKESAPLLAPSVRDVPDVFDRAVLASLTSKRSEVALGGEMKEALEKHLPAALHHKARRGRLLSETPFDSQSKMAAWAYLIQAPAPDAPPAQRAGAAQQQQPGQGYQQQQALPPTSPRQDSSSSSSSSLVRRAFNYVVGSTPPKGDGKDGGGEVHSFFRGAPDLLVEGAGYMWWNGKTRRLSPQDREALRRTLEAWCRDGLRVIGFATARGGAMQLDEAAITGFMAFHDPVRASARDAVAACQSGGVRVVMITGDHALTSAAVATEVGILASPASRGGGGGSYQAMEDGGDGAQRDEEAGLALGPASLRPVPTSTSPSAVVVCPDTPGWANDIRAIEGGAVFCRATPIDKLALVQALQLAGHIVAVTGDGVNDALALSAAHVGLAMGRSTDIAKAAAGIVMGEEDVGSLVLTLREGRRLFSNFRRAIAFYLGAKMALVLLFAALALPLAPIQVIVLELFMDVGASTTFTFEPAGGDIFAGSPPRDPKAPFFDQELLSAIGSGGASLLAVVLLSGSIALLRPDPLASARGRPQAYLQSLCFAGWLVGHVLLALNMRTGREPVVVKGVFSNWGFLAWAGSVLAVALLATYDGAFQGALGLVRLSGEDWALVVLIALVGTGWMEARKLLQWHSAGAVADRRRGAAGKQQRRKGGVAGEQTALLSRSK